MATSTRTVAAGDSRSSVLPEGVHLVGSVPLSSSEEVFRTAAEGLGDRLRRVPDGETGPRSDWIVWQYPVLSARPQFEVGPPAQITTGPCRGCGSGPASRRRACGSKVWAM